MSTIVRIDHLDERPNERFHLFVNIENPTPAMSQGCESILRALSSGANPRSAGLGRGPDAGANPGTWLTRRFAEMTP